MSSNLFQLENPNDKTGLTRKPWMRSTLLPRNSSPGGRDQGKMNLFISWDGGMTNDNYW